MVALASLTFRSVWSTECVPVSHPQCYLKLYPLSTVPHQLVLDLKAFITLYLRHHNRVLTGIYNVVVLAQPLNQTVEMLQMPESRNIYVCWKLSE